jgi:uncharacterized protein (TIGR00730 family)
MPPASSTTRPRLCVYLAAHHGTNPSFTTAARGLGAALTERNCDLVYGGGSVGLMGEVASTMLDRGSAVTGVITQHLYDLEVAHSELTELEVVPDMAARKKAMFEAADGFVILPGGVGTMEELFEVWCWSALGLHSKPLGMLNVDGYYDHLLAFIDRSMADGLMGSEVGKLLTVDEDPERLADALLAQIGVS